MAAAIMVVFLANAAGLSSQTVKVGSAPQLRGHGRRPLVSLGWIAIVLSFATAGLYAFWAYALLASWRGAVTPRDGLFYAPLLVLLLSLVWGIWAGSAYWRARHTRRAAKAASWAPSTDMVPLEGGSFDSTTPVWVAGAHGVVGWVMKFTRGSRHSK